jgi:peptide/nickel transport system substrate-binding protein
LSSFPGLSIGSGNFSFLITNRMHSKTIASAANRWTGANRAGYSNPRLDEILDKLVATVDHRMRIELQKELLKQQMGNVALMPLYWSSHTWSATATVRGITDGNGRNIFTWDKA